MPQIDESNSSGEYGLSNISTLDQFCSSAHECAMLLMTNALYIQKELPNVDLPAADRTAIENLCADWIGTKHDVVHEVGELKETPNIDERIRRIMSWLREDMVKLNEQVCRLNELAKSDDRFSLAYLLVAESGTNVLRGFTSTGDSAELALHHG